MKKKERIKQLDGMRAVMCVIVFISHLNYLNFPPTIQIIYDEQLINATLAVDFFFMLSGFGIYYVYHDSSIDISLKGSVKFAINKIKKIYPAYIISLIIGMIYIASENIIHNQLSTTELIKNLIKLTIGLSLTQSIIGDSGIAGTFNSTAWFISSLFFSYMLCPLFIKITNKIRKNKELIINIIITYLLIILLSFAAKSIEGLSFFEGLYKVNYLFYPHPIIRCLYLLLGMYIAYIYINIKINLNKHALLIFLAPSIAYFLFRERLGLTDIECRMIDIINCFFLMLLLLYDTSKIKKILSGNLFNKIGNNSMYIYIALANNFDSNNNI